MKNLSVKNIAIALAVSMMPAQAVAQGGPASGQSQQQRSVPPICTIQMLEPEVTIAPQEDPENPTGIVTAICDGRGYTLGEADGFLTMPHRESGAVIAVLGRENDRKVWLLSRREDNKIMLEDITPELAHASGRSPTANLTDIRVNLARFRATGVISAIPSTREGARPAIAADISLEERLMRRRDIGAANAGNAQ